MAKRLEEYEGRWRQAWEALPHPYLSDSVETDNSYYRSWGMGQVRDIPVSTYGAIWTEEEAPEPEELAQFCEDFLVAYVCGSPVPKIRKNEGGPFLLNPMDVVFPMDSGPLVGDRKRLIVRIAWGVDLQEDFYSGENRVRVRGRFGLLD